MLGQSIERWHARWADINPWLRFLIVAAVLGVLGVLVGKPAYQVFKDWRLERNLAAAKVAVTEERMDEARDLSLTVLRAGDPRIDTFRVLEKSMGALRDPLHGEISRALMAHPDSSDEDRLNGFVGVARESPMGVVGQAWTLLPVSCQQKPSFALAFADRLIAGQRFSEAAVVLLGVPESARVLAVEQALIRVLIGSRKQDGYEEAQRRLAARWPAGGGELDGWMDLLEELPVQGLKPALLEPIRKSLLDKAVADPARCGLALARIDYAASYAGRSELIERTITRWKADAPVLVAQWLRDLGLYQRLLATFPAVDSAMATPGLTLCLLEALERTEAWAEVAPLLAAGGEQLPKCEMLAHQAVAVGRIGDTGAKTEQWESAMAEAKFSGSLDSYLKLARIAETGGLPNEAAQAMLEAVLRGRGPLPLFGELKPMISWLVEQGRESNLLQVCATYLLFEPGNPVLLTQYAYLACLTSLVEPANLLKALKPMAKAFPDELPIQCVLAVAHLSNGEPAEAAEVLDRLKVDVERLAPGYRAAFLATQVLNERIDRQDPRITGFPWKSLLPSERKKFGEWLKVAAPAP